MRTTTTQSWTRCVLCLIIHTPYHLADVSRCQVKTFLAKKLFIFCYYLVRYLQRVFFFVEHSCLFSNFYPLARFRNEVFRIFSYRCPVYILISCNLSGLVFLRGDCFFYIIHVHISRSEISHFLYIVPVSLIFLMSRCTEITPSFASSTIILAPQSVSGARIRRDKALRSAFNLGASHILTFRVGVSS